MQGRCRKEERVDGKRAREDMNRASGRGAGGSLNRAKSMERRKRKWNGRWRLGGMLTSSVSDRNAKF